MKRYFYTGNRLTKTWLDHQYNMVRMEDQVYRDALLAALKLEPEKKSSFKQLKETMLNMTIAQQNQYANNYHMQALFKHFDSLHRNTQGRKMIMRGKQSLVRDLVDPDKFPIWDLKKKPTTFYSIWNSVMGKIRYDTGHQLVVRNSLIEHPEGGRGVFVSLPAYKKHIEVGEFLGLVPGSIYDSYESYKKLRLDSMKSYQRVPQHLHFPSGKVLQLSEYQEHDQISKNDVSLEPCMVNPYSLGQFINHPPYGQKPNVIFTEIEYQINFFPNHLKKYLPYNEHLPLEMKKKNKKGRIYAVFAREPIQNNEELYVDYCENHIYPIDAIPEWMAEPDYTESLNFSKEQYEHPSPEYWKLIEKQALTRNQELYEKYLKTVHYRPTKVLYEDGQIKIKGMSMSQPHPNTKE